jgi:hypothetical protein
LRKRRCRDAVRLREWSAELRERTQIEAGGAEEVE